MIRAFQWDLARQVERLDWLVAQLPHYAAWGYNELYLHLEDSIEFPSLPGVARKDAYSRRQFATLVEAAGRVGITVVPIVNLLGHTQYLIKVPALRDLNELRAKDGSPLPRGQVCPVHPRTLEVAEKLLRDIAPFCTAGRVHVGLDESFHLGGHPRSRAEIGRIGLAAHFAGYVDRLNSLARSLGLRLGYWADMLYFLPEAIPLLPKGTCAYDWYYHSFDRHPRVELFNFAERDLSGPLRSQGIEYWGCPMNSGFRHEPMPLFGERIANICSWWRRCHATHAAGMLITSWESSRIAQELTTVVDAAAASLWIGDSNGSARSMLARGFQRTKSRLDLAISEKAARAALTADRIAFAGYAKWELDDRWDVAGTAVRKRTPYVGPALAPRRHRLPKPLSASLGLTHYFNDREAFVRGSGAGVFELRRLHRAGTRKRSSALLAALLKDAVTFSRRITEAVHAADTMWTRTRSQNTANPNRIRLAADRTRLRGWIAWLRRARDRPASVRTRSPLCGTWQLLFTVENFAPALQKVVVEMGMGHGAWRTVHSRFTVEFRAAAARPKARIRRETSIPVASPNGYFRIGVRGVGSVRIAGVRLTDGVKTLRPLGARAHKPVQIGRPAPRDGMPELDWEKNIGEVVVRF